MQAHQKSWCFSVGIVSFFLGDWWEDLDSLVILSVDVVRCLGELVVDAVRFLGEGDPIMLELMSL